MPLLVAEVDLLFLFSGSSAVVLFVVGDVVAQKSLLLRSRFVSSASGM